MDIKYDQVLDPVHGFIDYNHLEKCLIHSRPFHRLKFIRQTGCVFLLYPGANHTRWDHSIGVMHLTTKIYEALIKRLREEKEIIPPIATQSRYAYWRQVVRLAALCHDLGHLPLSHTFEKEVFGKVGHELMTYRIIHSSLLKEVWQKIAIFLKVSIKRLIYDISAVALGAHFFRIALQETQKKPLFCSWRYVLSQIITSDFFGADRIDYLLRDAHFTGVVYGVFDYPQIIDTLRFFKKGKHLALGITHSGMQAVEGLILARYFMFVRVFYHPQTNSYAILFQSFFKKAFKNLKKDLQNPETFVQWTDNEFFSELTRATYDIFHPGHEAALKIAQFNYYKPIRIVYKKKAFAKKIWNKHLHVLKLKYKNLIDLHFYEAFVKKNSQKSTLPFWLEKSFLVGTHFRGKVASSEHYSEMISKIPSTMTPWVFVDPSIYTPVVRYLKKYGLFEC